MKIWAFADYTSPMGRNAISDWYKEISAQAKADFDVLIQFLEITRTWAGPAFRILTGKKYAGLSELRFKSHRKQYRVIGYFGPGQMQYTLLIGCTHKQQVYDPPSALDTAVKRKKSIESGEGSICEHGI